MISPSSCSAVRNRKVDAGIIEHTFSVVVFDDRRLRGEHSRVELYAVGQTVDANVYVQALHHETPSLEHWGRQTGVQGFPPQQFSVRKPNTPFIVSKFTE